MLSKYPGLLAVLLQDVQLAMRGGKRKSTGREVLRYSDIQEASVFFQHWHKWWYQSVDGMLLSVINI